MVTYFLSHAHFVIKDIVEEIFMDINSIYTSHCFWACLNEGEAFICWVFNSPYIYEFISSGYFSQGGHWFFIIFVGAGFYLCHFLHSWSPPSHIDQYVCCFWSCLLVFWSILFYFLCWLEHRCLLVLVLGVHPILLPVLMPYYLVMKVVLIH